MRVFLAGGAGVIGRALLPMLVQDGHEVVATTRSPERARWIQWRGGEPALLDVYDRDALAKAVARASPAVTIHQLTDLAGGLSPEDLLRNERLRREGTRNLVDACTAAGGSRIVAQSAAWLYADGPLPHRERDPFATPSEAPDDATLRGILELERLVLKTVGLVGVTLRYGYLYGPGTYSEAGATPRPRVSVGGAARAAALAVTRGTAGAYNVVDDDPGVSNARARAELGWQP